MRSLRRGRVQVASFTASGVSAVLPEFDILRAPFLFSSMDEVDFVLDEHITPLMKELLAAQDLHFFAFSDEGWFNLYGQTALPTLSPHAVYAYAPCNHRRRKPLSEPSVPT